MTETAIRVDEANDVVWSDPAVIDAPMRLWDLAGYLLLISDHASPAELLDVNRRARLPRVSRELGKLLDSLDGSAQ
jgi:hypothetical protein